MTEYSEPSKGAENLRELGKDAELYENEVSQRIEYDPSKLGTLTTEQMRAIEQAIDEGREQGASSDDLQEMVLSKLGALGFDASSIKDGVLVARIVDIDGNNIVRAIVIDPSDFGTQIRNAELTAVESPEATVEHPEDDELQNDRIEAIMQGLRDEVTTLERDMNESDETYGRLKNLINTLITDARLLGNKLVRNEPVDARATQELSSSAVVVAQTEADASGRQRLDANHINNATEEAMSGRQGFDDAHAEKLNGLLVNAKTVIDQLVSNRGQKEQLANQMYHYCGLLAQQLGEVQFSQHGSEQYGQVIIRYAAQLEQAFNNRDPVARAGVSFVTDLKRELAYSAES